jgi:hypothetical protein
MAILTDSDRALLRLYLNDPAGANQVLDDETLDKIYEEAGETVAGAAGRGWRIKAARVHDWYMVNLDGAFLNRDQVFKHCIMMAETFEAQGGGAELSNIQLTGPNADTTAETPEF